MVAQALAIKKLRWKSCKHHNVRDYYLHRRKD